MAGSFTGMHSAIAFRFRLRPNRRKVQRQRSLRLLGGRAKVSSGRLSVRFRVSRFDLNPWQRVKVKRSHFSRLVCGPVKKENAKLLFVRRDEKYYLIEVWSVLGKRVVTAEFEHHGEKNNEQREVRLVYP